MKDQRNTFGIPDTLTPHGLREVWNWLWLGFTGLFASYTWFLSTPDSAAVGWLPGACMLAGPACSWLF